jgi:segregation and condensation protein B
MKNIKSIIESLMLVSGKPLAMDELVKFLEVDDEEVKKAIAELAEKYDQEESGIHIAINSKKVQFTTNPINADYLYKYFKEELSSELSRPALETLTIIAYRQPISKEELEQIRGVNCSMIIRNLLIKGLIELEENKDSLVPLYSVTMDFLRHLGINSVEELPDFAKLNSDENLQKLIENNNNDENTENIQSREIS